MQKELLQSFFERGKLRLTRCLAPGLNCKNTAIQSHSLQNSRVLDLLARNGHVKTLTKRIEKGKDPVISFNDVGRNHASTFTGFCSDHDSSIFKSIDTAIFSTEEPEHLFLVAYRAVARELHVLTEAAYRIQLNYQDRIRLGYDSGNEPEPVGSLALEYMTKSYFTYRYKCAFDKALLSKNYTNISHDVLKLAHIKPTIAVCSLFSIDGVFKNNGDYVRVALNIIPQNNAESAVVFSFLPEDTSFVRPALNTIFKSEDYYQKYLLSKLVLNNCENFVLSPTFYDQWPSDKEQAITDYFVKTLFEGDLETENKHLYLF